MRRIQHKDLAELLMQLRFTPAAKRRKQLDAAEKLYAIIKADKDYPFEFVFYRITGFQHKEPVRQGMIEGDALLDDLRIFITALSGQIAPPVRAQREKVYTVEELAEALGISMKTVGRWRKRGLIARKFIFQDGIKRLGFLKSTVDRFLKANPEFAARARTFSRLSAAQKKQIIKRAVKLAAKSDISRHNVINKIAADIGRSPETVRSTVVNYEKANPDKSIFRKPPGVTAPSGAAEIYNLFKQGVPLEDLMKRFNRSKSSMYRLINARRAKALLLRKIEFIASDEFLQGDAKEKILAEPLNSINPGGPAIVEPFGQAGRSLPEYLRILKKTPVLNRERERELFRRYNYLKYLACVSRAGMKTSRVLSSRIKEVEGYLAEAEDIQRAIIEANLRLVVSIARKHTRSGANLSDLISEGNYALIRAVDKFDYTRGFRFATFASWAIAKAFARKMPSRTARRDKETATSHAKMQEDFREKDAADLAAIERSAGAVCDSEPLRTDRAAHKEEDQDAQADRRGPRAEQGTGPSDRADRPAEAETVAESQRVPAAHRLIRASVRVVRSIAPFVSIPLLFPAGARRISRWDRRGSGRVYRRSYCLCL